MNSSVGPEFLRVTSLTLVIIEFIKAQDLLNVNYIRCG